MIMNVLHGTREIIELSESHDSGSKISNEDDINKIFEAIEIGSSHRGIGHLQRHAREAICKSAMKRPIRVGPCRASGIGISEQVSLKQALRGLCISQASEMAAVKNRMSRPSASPGILEVGAEADQPLAEVKENLMEISLVPERSSFDISHEGEGIESVYVSLAEVEQIRSPKKGSAKKKIVPRRILASKLSHQTLDSVQSSPSSSTNADEKSRSRETGDFSQSSKSSIGEYNSTTSYVNGSSRSGYRPRMSKDLRWEAISSVQKQLGSRLGMTQFKLLRKIGGGDISTVYLSELIGTSCFFALKVMDYEFLSSRKKTQRAQTEKEILEIVDHPFLPTLYAHFTTNRYLCLVMEYCPGGDLHVLRQKQLTKSFAEKAARFYAAETLLALEYLHMLEVVHRDLKPENILVREDGHIMLSDFDLSLRCAANTMLLKSSSPSSETPKKTTSPCTVSGFIVPFCLRPSWQLSCFTPKFLTAAAKARKLKSELAAQVNPLPRSNSFVGRHEYLAPEIIRGEGHGSAVDWWAFGIFLYELLYGKTPFKRSSNEDTISNVVCKCLEFPKSPVVSSDARDLMRRLLKKEPDKRLGSAKEIKQHPFFEGLNWALIRCETPPELPEFLDLGNVNSKKSNLPTKFEERGDEVEFEMF